MTPNPENARWLSEAAEVLVREILAAPDAPTHCDLLIIGSGYGAAVAAARFAGARRASDGAALRVYLLERGEEYLAGQFPATFAEVPGHVRFSREDGQPARGKATGLFDLRIGGTVSALLGNGLGGGSLINAAVMERPSADAFEQGWPPGMDAKCARAGLRRGRADADARADTGAVPKLDSLLAAGARLATIEPPRKAQRGHRLRRGHAHAGRMWQWKPACAAATASAAATTARRSRSTPTTWRWRASAACACSAAARRIACARLPAAVCGGVLPDRAQQGAQRRPADLRTARAACHRRGRRAGFDRVAAALARGRAAAVGHARPGLFLQRRHDRGGLQAEGRRPGPAHRKATRPPSATSARPSPACCACSRWRRVAPAPRPLAIEEFAIPGPLRRVFAQVVTTTAALHGLARIDPTRHATDAKLPDPLAVDDAALDHTAVYGLMGDDGAAGRMACARRPTRRWRMANCASIGAVSARRRCSRRNWPRCNARMPAATASAGRCCRIRCGMRCRPLPRWRALHPASRSLARR